MFTRRSIVLLYLILIYYLTTVICLPLVTQPPTGITAQSINPRMTRVCWSRVNKVLTYRVAVWDPDNPSIPLMLINATTNCVDINNLPLCSVFTIGVSSINEFSEVGEPANITFRRTGNVTDWR